MGVLCHTALVLLMVGLVDGFAAVPIAVAGRGVTAAATSRRSRAAPLGAPLALRASEGSDEVDFDAFRDLLNDSWATQTAKSEDGEFDGYKFRDLIVSQWGAAYDIQIKREMWLGKPMLFLNVMWKYLGQQSFHLSEQEYLEHLQALAELVVKWDRVDHLKEEIRKQRKRPNAYFGYAVALPLNLPADVMEELQKENEF